MAVTRFVWDELGDNVRIEVDDAGVTTAEYANEPRQFGKLISQRRDSTNSFYHFDAQSSARQITSDTQDVSDSYTFSAFGENVSSSGSTINPFKYNGSVGYYTDSETGDVSVRRRMYSPPTARWLSIDPLRFSDGSNKYAYVQNEPTNKINPSGWMYFRFRYFDPEYFGGIWFMRRYFLRYLYDPYVRNSCEPERCKDECDHVGHKRNFKLTEIQLLPHANGLSPDARKAGENIIHHTETLEWIWVAARATGACENVAGLIGGTITEGMDHTRRHHWGEAVIHAVHGITDNLKRHGVVIWVKMEGECCDKKRCTWWEPDASRWILWQYRDRKYWRPHSYWYRCHAHGRGRDPAEGFDPDNAEEIKGAIAQCVAAAACDIDCNFRNSNVKNKK